MKTSWNKLFTAAISILTAAIILAGCGAAGESAPPPQQGGTAAEEVSGVDTSEFVTLKMFSISDAPNNQEMADAYYPILNEMTRQKLNAVIDITYAAGNDYANNYALALASGDPYDLLHAASGWLSFESNALKGAFYDLTDMIPKFAPTLWDIVGEDRWEAVKINGKIYGVPSTYNSYAEPSFYYREDLRKKYNCPEIVDLETIGIFLQAIKDNEPELLPSDDYQAQVYGTSFIYNTPYQIVDSQNDRHSNFVINPDDPRKVLSTLETPEYLPFMKLMKEWQGKGYWPSSVLSSTDWGVFSVNNGKAAASFNGQMTNYAYMVPQTEQEHPGWEMNYFVYGLGNPDSVIAGGSARGQMMACSRNAANPERALMFAELMHTDEELFRLTNYGIEGTHYQITDGKLDRTILTDPVTQRFNYFAGSIWDDSVFHLDAIDDWSRRPEFDRQLNERRRNILDGFVLDLSPIEAEYTAVGQLRIELGFPLQAGLVADVDAAYEEFKQRSLDTGLETCRLEIERQINAFLDSKGL
ncbi:MAG: extracellular solute-binding protein [Clostridiales bacterium]|jgi:putative aldouronate transport system substrate-binding protein|nr:extracellular solute-binding protein [Clostridiales bacterium]